MFFTNGCLCSLPRGLGCTYLQLEKAIYSLKKIKIEKESYVQLENKN